MCNNFKQNKDYGVSMLATADKFIIFVFNFRNYCNRMGNKKALTAHLCMLSAAIIWGLMSPIGKDAMIHGGIQGFRCCDTVLDQLFIRQV